MYIHAKSFQELISISLPVLDCCLKCTEISMCLVHNRGLTCHVLCFCRYRDESDYALRFMESSWKDQQKEEARR